MSLTGPGRNSKSDSSRGPPAGSPRVRGHTTPGRVTRSGRTKGTKGTIRNRPVAGRSAGGEPFPK
ncbi:hypothetical protein TR74_18075 [Carbonactinospora thermoautotrophica]|uniref:Uncharacterized protein n=1 Tax=Carbonactinospora thermoautotrophica TaxID=1469144 RepID=A0A132NC24_9ACTN|nr:hypothetical protein TR74_18075 [Carbonactinospora thermoautotrophica]